MGGYGSGRHGGVATVSDALRLDLAHCLRSGMIVPGKTWAGTMQWSRNGKVTASLRYEAYLTDPHASWLRLQYKKGPSDGPKQIYDYCIRLEITRPNYGGVRWWFQCPVSNRRAGVLYLPLYANGVFAARQVWRLVYPSQRLSPEDRAVQRSIKARDKLNIRDYDMLEIPDCPKPKWMRWRTYRRHVESIEECLDLQLQYTWRRWGPLAWD
jgi:hypothetical protein